MKQNSWRGVLLAIAGSVILAGCATAGSGEPDRWAAAKTHKITTPRAKIDVKLVQADQGGYEYWAYLRRFDNPNSDNIQRQRALRGASQALANQVCEVGDVTLQNRAYLRSDYELIGRFDCPPPKPASE